MVKAIFPSEPPWRGGENEETKATIPPKTLAQVRMKGFYLPRLLL